MDSRLLNVFHDDPFDGSYIKYDDNNADFWSSGSESLGLQLAETLHGILPIAPTEDVSVLYGNTIIKDDYTLDCKEDAVAAMQTKNALIYDDFAEHHVDSVGDIEIVTVNPDGVDSENDDDSEDADDESDINDAARDQFDTLSQRSYATFRSRTDSSSIGDYESHSSDYDDDDDDVDYNNDNIEIMENAHGHYIHVPELSNNAEENIPNFKLPLETTPNFKSKNRTLSTNTIGSDVDGLGLHIDASTFDLADFITKDDFSIANSSLTATNNKTYKTINSETQLAPVSISPEAAPVQIISSHNADSDSDSDVIVDVETVEFDVEEEKQYLSAKLNSQIGELQKKTGEDLIFEDNTNSDPSWSPAVKTNSKKEIPKETKPTTTTSSPSPPSIQNHQNQQLQHNFPRSFSVVPSKRQCDFLKGKFGSGRGKNISLQQRHLKTSASKTIDSKLEPTKTPKNQEQIALETNAVATSGKQLTRKTADIKNKTKMGVGQGGKNLSLIKHDRKSISEQSSEENLTPQKICNEVVPQESEKIPSELPQLKTVKRKLNLEEYKKRIGERNGENVSTNNSATCKTPKLEKTSLKNPQQNCLENKSQPSLQKSCQNVTAKNNTAVATIVQSLKAQATQPPKPSLDPITEAKNKVLRMQELKKAQLLKIIDSTISAKVPRVTKMLPLKDMVTNSSGKSTAMVLSNNNASKANEEYEEIVIVSASCNTIISIPPINILPNCQQDAGIVKLGANNASRSLLKSSALMYNISNTFQKVQASENVKLTSNSLITSIQGVVAKQTSCASRPDHNVVTPTSSPVGVVNRNSNKAATVIIAKNAINTEQHGEDKIIMHLRKDRIRTSTCSASMQTDFVAEFPPLPPLPLPINAMERKSRDRMRQKRAARNYRVHKELDSQDRYHKESGSDVSSCFEADRSYRSRSRSCTGDGCSSSQDRLRRSDGVGGGGYSSRSSRRHRSSISSSYSESERKPVRRIRKSHYKSRSSKKYSRSSSNSSTDFSDRSRSRSRSRSPLRRSRSSSKRSFVDRNVFQPAVEERRIVYVGRIEQETTKEMLRRKFIAYGPIKQITIHYKDTGMKYGFVTYDRSQDAFNVIDNSARDSHINMYDISFGGRRAFCRASYADLDNAGINTYQSYVFPQAVAAPKEEDSFEALLLKVKAKMNASKMSTSTTKI